MNRPRGLGLTALLMVVCNAMGWAIIDWSKPHAAATFIGLTILIVIGYVFIWFYWRGRNWARIAVLLTSILSIYNLRYWNHSNMTMHIMIASEAAMGVFLLYWLNTRPVRMFFKPVLPRGVSC
jgi:phosphatidylserine synthase